MSRHRLTVSLVGRREGTGLLTSLPSLCFGPSVHASGRQGQGPARFLVPLVNRGPVARRASSVGTAHSVHSPAPGGGRNERSEERAVILPSHHGPSPSLPAEPGQGSDRLSLISSVPSLRRVTSFPFHPFHTTHPPFTSPTAPERRVKGWWVVGKGAGGKWRGPAQPSSAHHSPRHPTRPHLTPYTRVVILPPLVTLRLTSSTSLVSSGGRREDTTDGRRRETSGERKGTVGERLTNERSEWRKIRVTVPSLSPVPFVPSSFGPSRPRSFLTSVARFLTSSGTTGRKNDGTEWRWKGTEDDRSPATRLSLSVGSYLPHIPVGDA